MSPTVFIIYFFSIITFIEGAKILAMFGAGLKSHLHCFGSLVEYLSLSHEITFYVPEDFEYNHDNITVVKGPSVLNGSNFEKVQVLQKPCAIKSFNLYCDHILHTDEPRYIKAFEHENIQKLINSEEKFDLLLLNAYVSEHYFLFAHKFNIPVIQATPSLTHVWISESVGGQVSWEKDLNFMINGSPDTYFGRTKRYMQNWMATNKFYKTYLPTLDNIASKYFHGYPPIEEIMKSRTEIVFLNSHTAMGLQRHMSPSFIQVGGMHISNPKSLPKELEEFISSAEHGVIYFSLGTFVRYDSLDPKIIGNILKVFGKLKQKVLWKWSGTIENIPNNVMVSKWVPQQDILRHNNVKLFVTQGGMMSFIESSTFGKPVLVMPVIFDQYTNAYAARKVGYGEVLNFCQFTEELFYEKIINLINNPKYQEKSKQVAQVLQHDIKFIKEKINFWVNFVIENHKNSFLRRLRTNVGWLESTSAEIGFTFITIIVIVVLLLICVCKQTKLLFDYFSNKSLKFKCKLKYG